MTSVIHNRKRSSGQRKWGRKRTKPTTVLLSLAVMVAAVGVVGAPASAATRTLVKATAKPWTVGIIMDKTGPGAATTPGEIAATNYWVKKLNAAGGINGHPIRTQTCDDQSTTQGGATCGAQLAGVSSHAVLLLTSNPPSQGAETQLTNTFGLAISAVLNPPVGSTVFVSTPPGPAVATPIVKQAAAGHIKTIGVIYTSDSSGKGQLAAISSVAPSYGVKIVSEPMDPTATDVTTQLVRLRSDGAQLLYSSTLGKPTEVVLSSYHTLGLTLPIVVGGGNTNNSFLKSLSFTIPPKMYGATNMLLGPTYPTSKAKAAWKSFVKAWKKAEPKYPMDQEVVTTSNSWCLLDAVLTGAGASSGRAEASYLTSHAINCFGSAITYTNKEFNVPNNIPSGLVQAPVKASAGWGPIRTKLSASS